MKNIFKVILLWISFLSVISFARPDETTIFPNKDYISDSIIDVYEYADVEVNNSKVDDSNGIQSESGIVGDNSNITEIGNVDSEGESKAKFETEFIIPLEIDSSTTTAESDTSSLDDIIQSTTLGTTSSSQRYEESVKEIDADLEYLTDDSENSRVDVTDIINNDTVEEQNDHGDSEEHDHGDSEEHDHGDSEEDNHEFNEGDDHEFNEGDDVEHESENDEQSDQYKHKARGHRRRNRKGNMKQRENRRERNQRRKGKKQTGAVHEVNNDEKEELSGGSERVERDASLNSRRHSGGEWLRVAEWTHYPVHILNKNIRRA